MKKLFVILLPFIPLFEGMFRVPYFSPKYMPMDSTIPILQMLMLLLLLLFGWAHKKTIKANLISTLFLIITVTYSIFMVSSLHSITLGGGILLAYLLVYLDYNHDEALQNLDYFTKVLFALVVAVWVVRLISKGGNVFATRAGSNIYGANAIVNIFLVGFVCQITSIKFRNDIFWLIGLLFVSLIFISRTGIVVSLLVCFVWSFLYFKQNKKLVLWLYAFSIILAVLSFVFIDGLLDVVFTRFGLVGDGASILEIADRMYRIQVDLQRGVIWKDALNLIESYPLFGAGIGEFKNFGFFTSAHNILLNNWAEFGILLGTVLNLIFISPLVFL